MIIPIPKPTHTLRILHTADWHLGKRLFDQARYDEFEAFLNWLIDCIKQNQVDILIVAGDIFDTMTPSNKAQELYYNFLAKLTHSNCHHTIIIAGNHDSPSFLDAPKHLLHHFNIHIIGTANQDLSKEHFILNDKNNTPILIIATVPYLRERDVRMSEFGDSLEQKQKDMLIGIKNHYATLAQLCKSSQKQLLHKTTHPIPILATGHLFAAGSQISAPDDGMRELYVGTLGQIGVEIFDGFDYVALGHIHREQMVAKQPHIRYSGSPMAFCFDEVNQDKKVLLVDFNQNTTPIINPIIIPKFRHLKSFIGDFDHIQNELMQYINGLKSNLSDSLNEHWISVECYNKTPIFDLEDKIEKIIENTSVKLINLKQINANNHKKTHQYLSKKSLQELTPKEVFSTFLNDVNILNNIKSRTNKKDENNDLSNDDKDTLMAIYDELLYDILHNDKNAI